jgi:hypothetical protein
VSRFLRWTTLACLIVLLAACGPGRKLVVANQGITVLDLQLDTSLDWSREKGPRVEVWTIDGVPLNRFLVVAKVKPNEHVFLAARERKSRPDGPWFRTGMRADEVRDVLVDAFRQGGWSRISTTNLRPVKFGSVDGLRFEATMTSDNGLIYKAQFGAAEHDGKLTHFQWLAPAEYYYDRDAAAVDRMIASVRFIK